MEKVKILYADRSVIVAVKPAGAVCEADCKDSIIPLIKEAANLQYVGLVHRLDQVTSGVMLFSADEKLTGKLTEAIISHDAEKEYLAVVHGRPDPTAGEMKDLLYRDASKNKSYTVKKLRRGVREAKLDYLTADTKASEYGEISLVKIKLHTGRTHQIRVQFSSRQMPLVGDGKYGARDNVKNVALLSRSLSFTHPKTGKRMTFEADVPDSAPWNLFE